MENIQWDLLLKRIREHLNGEKISLWLAPYTLENKERGSTAMDELAQRLSQEFSVPQNEVANAIEELRIHSLVKLEERDRFKSQGLATLRVKVTCPIPAEGVPRKPVPIECSLSLLGRDLKELIAAKSSVSPDLLKLICKGRVIDEDKTLETQGVKHGSDLMAMCLSASEAKLAEKEAQMMEVAKTRKAAELLSSRSDDDDDFDVQIADQNGQSLSLPKEEKKALTLAMTLHEKGRATLKGKQVAQALLLLLEADSEFNKCSAGILAAVDNYAILCLDIVWCYLLMKNLEQLPDAERRLTSSESCFKRSYGEKMERLTAIKGGTGMEQALFMRLYLLQGIVAFHKGDFRNAQNLFRRAEFVLNLLHVDDDKLNEVMVMGFSEKEARLGLRAKSGNIQQTVDYIMQMQKEQEENNKKAKKEWQQRVQVKKLGKTANGQNVNTEMYQSLVAMEFPRGAAAEALRQSNNDINLAMEILQSHPELLSLPDPEKEKFKVTEEMMQQVVNLGFDVEMARRALQSFHGSIERAVEELLSHGGTLPSISSSWSTSSLSTSSELSTGDSSASPDDSDHDSPEKSRKRKQEKEELDALVSDINTDANDHLDLTLSEEQDILQTYQSMAASLEKS